MSLRRYTGYAPSGIVWLPELPSGWTWKRFRFLFQESPEKIEGDVVGPMLSVSGYRGVEVKQYDDENRRRSDDELQGYRIVRPGQLVVNTMWMNYAGLGVSEVEGHVSPAYRAYTFRAGLDRRYAHHLLRSSIYVQAYTRLLTGIRPNSLQMSREDLMDFPVILPPLAEQHAIATFLDRETAKIDTLVAEQERLLELLSEQRRSALSVWLRRGTASRQARTRQTGVPWIGEVPEHWAVTNCGLHCSVTSGFAFPSSQFSSSTDDVPLLRGVNIAVGKLRWDDVVYWKRRDGDGLGRFELAEGDIVLGMDRPVISGGVRVARVNASDLPCLLLQRVARIRTDSRLRPEFLMLLLASEMFDAHFLPETTGVSVPHISPEQIASFPVPLPPVSEQAEIVRRAEELTSRGDSLVRECEGAIDLLQERRAALISAAVTGQIDVRGLVAA